MHYIFDKTLRTRLYSRQFIDRFRGQIAATSLLSVIIIRVIMIIIIIIIIIIIVIIIIIIMIMIMMIIIRRTIITNNDIGDSGNDYDLIIAKII